MDDSGTYIANTDPYAAYNASSYPQQQIGSHPSDASLGSPTQGRHPHASHHASASLSGTYPDEMMKRTSSQTHEGQGYGQMGPFASNGGVGGPINGSDAVSKKARFVSDGNIPNYGSLGYGNMPQSAPGGGMAALGNMFHQQGNLAQAGNQGMVGMQQASGYSPGNMPLSAAAIDGSRSFSASMIGGANLLGGSGLGAGAGGLGGMPFGAGAGGMPYPLTIPNAAAFMNAQAIGGGYGSPTATSPSGGNFGMAASGPGSAISYATFANALGGNPNGSNFMMNPMNGANQMGAAAPGRTVYVGNLPADASVDELLSLVKFGPIESVKILPEKNCAFISFLEGGAGSAFHADACVKKISLHGQELKIGWGKTTPLPASVLMAVQQHQATRNVYLGQLEPDETEQSLRDDLARFGPIDQVKIVRDKNIGFVHFLSIQTAMKVVATLPTEPAWAGKRVHYGKDRCAYVPKSQQQNQQHNNNATAMGMAAAASLGYPLAFSPATANFGGFSPNQNDFMEMDGRTPSSSLFGPAAAVMGANTNALQQMGNRTIYLGNIHPDTTTEEICNHIRGGILQNVRYIAERHISFVTFVDPNAALAFFHLSSYQGIMIHNRRLKIGWGKHSGPLSPAIAMAVQAGGSRNVYIGNIDDPQLFNVEKLKRDFGDFGEVELVNTLEEKNCAFVNFCNIQNAIKAMEAMKNHPDYQKVKIAYGKDRCGNAPRSGAQGGQRKASEAYSHSAHTPAASPRANEPSSGSIGDNSGDASENGAEPIEDKSGLGAVGVVEEDEDIPA
ncbi:unnamed protein product [Tilletia controversa]|uniref:RRM domain-containing protein n=1 Tax=Tilletia controversa TaxID=13291 RepID=A0A8X7SZH6_9BASI|nr:hypothetical protein CF328_g1668 [Tilletia controversa]KAE8253827.1 hypothetical protein A4X06_0g1199 [Tilletia controversa]CAD6910572.1 unnamed protein product [Tilletia controversa]CAD6961480.1 unnamed protein product [Tilletia controversa]CAD6971779.1 unnamed protein product [Tilletia controversa]